MTTLLQTQAATHKHLTSHADMPSASQASQCAVNVVILAGSFNARFCQDVQAKAKSDTLSKDPAVNMIRCTKVCSREKKLMQVDSEHRHAVNQVSALGY